MHPLTRLLAFALLTTASTAGHATDPTDQITTYANPNGSVVAVLIRDNRSSIFRTPPGTEFEALRDWARDNARFLNIDSEPSNRLKIGTGLRPVSVPSADFGALKVYRYPQTYRGLPIVGSAKEVAITIAPAGRVIAINGSILDEATGYDGLLNPIDAGTASDEIGRAWILAGNQRGEVENLAYVAVPERRLMAYQGDIVVDGQTVATIIISAVDASLIIINGHRDYDAFVHKPIGVLGYAMTNDPQTVSTQFFPFPTMPGSTFDACTPLPPNGFGCNLRMGNDRFTVYDFELDNASAPTIWTTIEYQPGIPCCVPVSVFTENDDTTFQFKTQNSFQKMQHALAFVDPIKGPIGWDHQPGAPFGLFTPAPLSLLTNLDSSPAQGEPDICEGALGWFDNLTFDAGWDLVEHPYMGNQFKTSGIVLCSQDEAVAFHELGHYLDNHSTFKTLGSGNATGTCIQDTPDEALPLRETLADMAALVFYRKLYATLNYEITTSASNCGFGPLGTTTAAVHGSPCTADASDVIDFSQNRPGQDFNNICNVNVGYQQRAVYQAWWEFLNGRLCSPQSPTDCSVQINAASADAVMEAMLYALSLSNLQSYRQFFENMGVWLAWMYPIDYKRYLEIMLHHGILE